jgi:biotin transport system substrate-specific component
MQEILTKKINLEVLKDITLVLTLTIFLSLFAKVYIPLYFTPIPLFLQNSIALSYIFFFKNKIAYSSIMLFIILGLVGLPVFNNGNFGVSYLFSYTGGYIFAYFISTFVISKLQKLNIFNTFTLLVIAHLLVLTLGSLYLAYFLGIKKAILLGFLPFVATDLLKCIFITKLHKKIKA